MNARSTVPAFAYVGCFTTQERKARGKGISVFRIDAKTKAWELVQVCEALANPGFVVLDSAQKFLYSAHGIATLHIYSATATGNTDICAYAVDQQTGRLKLINKQPTDGDNSRVVRMDPGNRYAVVANGAGLAVFPIDTDGSIAPHSDMVVPEAVPGTFRAEEKGPHPHDVVFDPSGRFIVVPDKGLDKIHVYRLDRDSGKLIENEFPSMRSRYGAAPRHAAFHPTRSFAYIVNERDATVATYKWDGQRGELTPLQILPAAPATFTGSNKASEIAVAGNFVYASNRGHDSIGIFAIDDNQGTLTPVGWEATQGKKPRFFTLDADGDFLYVANEGTDTIVVFAVDKVSGKLISTGQVIKTESPSCIAFAYR